MTLCKSLLRGSGGWRGLQQDAAERSTPAHTTDISHACLPYTPVQPLDASLSLSPCPAPGILLAVTTIYQYFEMFVKENGQDNALASFF